MSVSGLSRDVLELVGTLWLMMVKLSASLVLFLTSLRPRLDLLQMLLQSGGLLRCSLYGSPFAFGCEPSSEANRGLKCQLMLHSSYSLPTVVT